MVVYLDNAATSWPKPAGVAAAVARWFAELGVDAARGSSQRHETVGRAVGELRQRLAALCGVPPRHVVLTSGATEAINLFLKGFLTPGDRVWTTVLEHNAVARPLLALRDRLGIDVRVLEPSPGEPAVSASRVLAELEMAPPPRLLVYTHASNVTGAVQDLGSASPALRAAGVRILVDCAQTAGRLPLAGLLADAWALPGHKGLLGPPGTGALCLAEDLGLHPLREGGTGSSRASDRMPVDLPQRLESGTPNTPGLLGWLAALQWLASADIDTVHQREMRLALTLRQALAPAEAAGRLRLLGGRADSPHVALLSVAFADLDPVEAALVLEASGVLVRAGFHCAPWVHAWLGTAGQGTLRISPGVTTTQDEVQTAASLLLELAGA